MCPAEDRCQRRPLAGPTALQHGLIQPSFVPAAEQRVLRDLTRARTSMAEERVRLDQPGAEDTEDTNISSRVASDVMGVPGQSDSKH